MGFVANFICFPAVQKFWKSVEIWQSYREFKGGNFFETQCSLTRDHVGELGLYGCGVDAFVVEELFDTDCNVDVVRCTATTNVYRSDDPGGRQLPDMQLVYLLNSFHLHVILVIINNNNNQGRINHGAKRAMAQGPPP